MSDSQPQAGWRDLPIEDLGPLFVSLHTHTIVYHRDQEYLMTGLLHAIALCYFDPDGTNREAWRPQIVAQIDKLRCRGECVE